MAPKSVLGPHNEPGPQWICVVPTIRGMLIPWEIMKWGPRPLRPCK